MTRFITQLKERRVAQWSLAYLGGGWVLLQVAAMLSETYSWAPWLMRALPVLVATGFVAAVITAWHHGASGPQRFHSTELILLAVVLAGGGAMAWAVAGPGSRTVAPATATSKILRIAVLPFEPSSDGGDTAMAEGISDEIRGKLVTLRGLEVIARSSSNEFRGKGTAAADIARQLDVEYLLTGTVRLEDALNGKPARMRVSPELVQIVDGSRAPVTRWQDAFDENVTDVFDVQTRIARRVADAMNIALGAGDEARIAEKPTENKDAWLKYLEARTAENSSIQQRDNEIKAAARNQEAVRLDPNFTLAWSDLARQAGLAQWLEDRGNPNGEYYKLSRHAADEAMRLSPQVHGPYAEGSFLLWAKLDFTAAHDRFLKALENAPSDEGLMTGLCASDEFLGDWDAAAEQCDHSARINPLSQDAIARSAISLALAGRMAEALKYGDRLRELAVASGLPAMITRAESINLRLGMYDGRVAELQQRFRDLEKDDALSEGVLANNYEQFFFLYEASQQRRVLAVIKPGTPADKTPWIRSVAYHLIGDDASARRTATEAIPLLEKRIATSWPAANFLGVARSRLAIAYWLKGDTGLARHEAERSLQVMPFSTDGINAPTAHREDAWVLLELGDTMRALQVLGEILDRPRSVTKAEIRADPRFASLRSKPEFLRMTAQK